MCIIVVKPIKKPLPKKCIENCWSGNKDGAGIMYALKGKLHVEKYVTLQDFKKRYYQLEHIVGNETNMVLHFRFCTHGVNDITNVHPFFINENLAFCHNGIFDIDIDDPFISDTQIFNEKVLKLLPVNFLEYSCLTELLRGYAGTDNKLVFLDNKGVYTIFNEIDGIWDKGGCWFSNSGYKAREYEYTKLNNSLDYYYPPNKNYQSEIDQDYAAYIKNRDKRIALNEKKSLVERLDMEETEEMDVLDYIKTEKFQNFKKEENLL